MFWRSRSSGFSISPSPGRIPQAGKSGTGGLGIVADDLLCRGVWRSGDVGGCAFRSDLAPHTPTLALYCRGQENSHSTISLLCAENVRRGWPRAASRLRHATWRLPWLCTGKRGVVIGHDHRSQRRGDRRSYRNGDEYRYRSQDSHSHQQPRKLPADVPDTGDVFDHGGTPGVR